MRNKKKKIKEHTKNDNLRPSQIISLGLSTDTHAQDNKKTSEDYNCFIKGLMVY